MPCWTKWNILIPLLRLQNFTCGQSRFNDRMEGITPIIHIGLVHTHALVHIGDPTGVIIPIGENIIQNSEVPLFLVAYLNS